MLPRPVVATNAVTNRVDIVVVPARNIIPIVVVMDDDATGDFIVVFGILFRYKIESGMKKPSSLGIRDADIWSIILCMISCFSLRSKNRTTQSCGSPSIEMFYCT